LPSLYEGFGIPVLEAMSYDCPVISSFASSLPEVGGEAAVYFDPQNVDGLVDDLESLKSESLRTELIQKGREQIKKFSWDTCGEKTLAVIKKVAK
jgi:glycosyltransferase involved in cell wall biosynthesis